MDLTPAQVTGTEFRTVRKGYDSVQVDEFLADVASALEAAQQQATAMEARARAAVARLQEMSERAGAATPASPDHEPSPQGGTPGPDGDVAVGYGDAEIISRTLLLAQRTADATIADATEEAGRIRDEARSEAEATLDSTREMSAQLIDEAKAEARRASDAEVRAAENEVQSLVARREFLVGDVEQLERFLVDQRDRLRDAARSIEALCDRIPAGLGQVNAPLLSAADDEPGDDTSELFRPATVADDAARGDDAPDAPGEGPVGASSIPPPA